MDKLTTQITELESALKAEQSEEDLTPKVIRLEGEVAEARERHAKAAEQLEQANAREVAAQAEAKAVAEEHRKEVAALQTKIAQLTVLAASRKRTRCALACVSSPVDCPNRCLLMVF